MGDLIEAWFFAHKKDAKKDNLEQADGYAKVEDSILKERTGNTELAWCYIRSESIQGRFRSKEVMQVISEKQEQAKEQDNDSN